MNELTGVIQTTEQITQQQAADLRAQWKAWAEGPRSEPVVLSNAYFRQMLPDGTLEPMPPTWEITPSVTTELLETSRDYLPWATSVLGWIVALALALTR